MNNSNSPDNGEAQATLLYYVAYCSRASVGVDDAAVDCIIETSQRNNRERSITGMLVFGSGIFFQWLEGPRESVVQLLATIKTDSRHLDVVALSESEEVRGRLFSDWDMERVSHDDIRATLEHALATADDPNHVQALTSLLGYQLKGYVNWV